MTSYYTVEGSQRKFKKIEEARKVACSLVSRMTDFVTIYDDRDEPVGAVARVRQDDPEHNIVFRYHMVYRNFKTDRLGRINVKTGTITSSYPKGTRLGFGRW